MKKKTLYIVSIILVLIISIGFLTYKTETVFSEYAEVIVSEKNYNFGKKTKNDTINHTFYIKNISSIPFVITKVLPSCSCTVINSKINLLYKKDETAKVSVQYIPKPEHIGKEIENIILVQCNANKGLIKLKIKGSID